MARSPARAVVLLSSALAVSCSSAEPTGSTRAQGSAIVGGRPSSDDENAAVLVETTGDTGTLDCSGFLVAPRLVITVAFQPRTVSSAQRARKHPHQSSVAQQPMVHP